MGSKVPQINSINRHLYSSSPPRVNLPPTRRAKASRSVESNSLSYAKNPSLYCTAEPGSAEWKSYQARRVKSLRNLKARNKLMTSVASKLRQIKTGKIQLTMKNSEGILKNALEDAATNSLSRQRSRSNSIRWRDPIEETPKLGPNVPTPAVRMSKSLLKNSEQSKNPIQTKNSKISGEVTVSKSKSRLGVNHSKSKLNNKASLKNIAPPGVTKVSHSSKSSSDNVQIKTFVTSENSLGDLVAQLKAYGVPPTIPDLTEPVSRINKSPRYSFKDSQKSMSSKLAGFKKSLSEYGKGIHKITNEINVLYRKQRRNTLDELALSIRELPNHFTEEFKAHRVLRQQLLSPLTIFGDYLIRHVTNKSNNEKKDSGATATLHLTSYDNLTFQLEISLPLVLPGVKQKLAQLVADESYTVDIDPQFNILSIKVAVSENTVEDIQIRVPDGKRVETDVAIAHPNTNFPNGNRILVTGIL